MRPSYMWSPLARPSRYSAKAAPKKGSSNSRGIDGWCPKTNVSATLGPGTHRGLLSSVQDPCPDTLDFANTVAEVWVITNGAQRV